MTPVRWTARGAAEVPDADDWLTPGETAVLNTLRFEKRRTDWRLGRWTAKHALAAYPAVDGHSVSTSAFEVRADDDGAPEAFLDGAPLPVTLSLTHRHGLAVCAVAPAPTALGCDLERLEPRSGLFVEDYFTPAEQSLVSRAEPADRPLVANLVWSAKESALKALRQGLRMAVRSLEVTLPDAAPTGPWRPLIVRHVPSGRMFHGWWRTYDGFVLTLVADPAPDVPLRT